MKDHRSPIYVLIAFRRIMSMRPKFVEEENWLKIAEEVQSALFALQQSEDQSSQRKNSMQLMGLLSKCPPANERLHAELLLQRRFMIWAQQEFPADLLKHTTNPDEMEAALVMMQFATQWEPTDDVTAEAEKSIQVHDGEIGKGQSIKFKNLDFDFTEISQLASGSLMTAFNMVSKPHPLVITAGILMIITSFVKAMTVSFSEQDSSVFWGMIQTQNANYVPDEMILLATNNMRTEYGFPLLNETQLRKSLQKLTKMECISRQKVGDVLKWRIIEKYKIVA